MAHSPNNVIQVTALDFNEIKEGIRSYISSQPEFLDYNFEGSTISLLLDILAYNTYQNAFYTSMVGNEMFLDSAQLRDSVVSRAKMLGYTPRSYRGAFTTANVDITGTGDFVTVEKNATFSVTIDGSAYTYVTPQEYVIPIDTAGDYKGTITIVEGTPLQHDYLVDSLNPQRYILPNERVDTTSIEVTVQESSGSATIETFTQATDILDVNANSAIYYLQEIEGGQYEILFGDGVLGKSLTDGNVVNIFYRVCNGDVTNGVTEFSAPSTLGGFSFTYTLNGATAGGDSFETIESIKFNAPKSFSTQNRAVLESDYKNLILENFGDISSLRVWGGETNTPPVYGKVFISGKTTTSTFFSQALKDQIINFLKAHNVMSIDIEFIDPTYLYILPYITVNYDSSKTTLSSDELSTLIESTIQDYETTNLGSFDNTELQYSRFIRAIDDTNPSIRNSYIDIKLQKRFTPNWNNSTRYTINFGNALEVCRDDGTSVVQTNSFVIGGRTSYLDDDAAGNVRLYYIDTNEQRVYTNNTQGTIDYSTGVIVLNSFDPTSSVDDEIVITVVPRDNDVVVKTYQLMLLSNSTYVLRDISTGVTYSAKTVDTTGSTTQINEEAIGTIV